MKSLRHSYSMKDGDEYYTPKILVDAIMPFVEDYIDQLYSNWNPNKPIPTIWCPFDTEKSEFVKALNNKFGKTVNIIHSHISEEDGNFFDKIETIGQVDLVVSNPPFSKKLDIIKKLNEKKITFALLLNIECLNYQVMGNYFVDNPISLIIPDKKVSFNGKQAGFCSGFICSPAFYGNGDSIVKFIHLEHNNTGENFSPSEMYS